MMAKHFSQEDTHTKTQTRDEMKKQKREAKQQKEAGMKRIRVRLIPIWLRILLVTIFIALSLVAGLMVGYSVIGDGEPKDVLQKSTWTHIIDLVTEKK